jgi:hypothetical protein
VSYLGNNNLLQALSFVFWVIIIGNIIYKIFIGSIKYDINDSMLAGQNEAAERFFRRSLSILHSLAESLRSKWSVQVSNYYIWVAFFEIYSHIEWFSEISINTVILIEESNKLVQNPSMSQKKADKIAIKLIGTFLSLCINPQWKNSEKSIRAINDELHALKNNTDEAQEMADTRLGVIFTEVASLLESQWETLFKK